MNKYIYTALINTAQNIGRCQILQQIMLTLQNIVQQWASPIYTTHTAYWCTIYRYLIFVLQADAAAWTWRNLYNHMPIEHVV